MAAAEHYRALADLDLDPRQFVSPEERINFSTERIWAEIDAKPGPFEWLFEKAFGMASPDLSLPFEEESEYDQVA